MCSVIRLDQYKRKKLGQRSFKYWNAQFRQSFDDTSQLKDLPDNVLLFLASPGEKSAGASYQLIEQIRCLTGNSDGKKEPHQVEMDLMDIHLYLTDKFRFEMMLRLGWIEHYSDSEMPILDLILEYDQNAGKQFDNPPPLAMAHPQFAEYQKLIPREQELFVRKLFVHALIEFNRKVNK